MSFTPIQLDKVRNFRFGMRAISVMEKKLKTSMSKLDFNNMTMEDTAIIMWAGLQHEDSKLTPDMVMDLVDKHSNLKEVIKVMAEAFSDSFGKAEFTEDAPEKND